MITFIEIGCTFLYLFYSKFKIIFNIFETYLINIIDNSFNILGGELI